jgi:hypothetical protein
MSRIRDIANLFSGSTDAATDAEVSAAVSAHNSTTTSVHGISDTSALATTSATSSAISTAVSTHSSDTTDVHGITDTSVLTTATSLSSAISTHATAANGHSGRGTTANRPASPTVGDLYYDTDLKNLYQYNAVGWTVAGVVGNPGVTGGTLSSDSTYFYRTFTSSGTLGVFGLTL